MIHKPEHQRALRQVFAQALDTTREVQTMDAPTDSRTTSVRVTNTKENARVTTTSTTPEHLRHHEYGTDPFTDHELAAIREYEEGNSERTGATLLVDLLDQAQIIADRTEANTVGEDGLTAEQIRDTDRAAILACFQWLSEWYDLLDTLKAGLSNGTGEGPVHSRAAARHLKQECNRWYQTLHLVRREACKYAFGTAGPQPEVDAGYLTFFDVPGVPLDGTIAAESQ